MADRRTSTSQERRIRDRRSSSRARRAVGMLPTALVMLLTLALIVALVRGSAEQARQADSVRSRQELVQIAVVRQQAMAATQRAHVELLLASRSDPEVTHESLQVILTDWKTELSALSESLPHESTNLSTETMAKRLSEFLVVPSTEVVGVDALTGARTRLLPVEDRLSEAAVQSGLDGEDGAIDEMTAMLYAIGIGIDTTVAAVSVSADSPPAWRSFGLVIRTLVSAGGIAVLTAGPLTGLTSLSEPHPYIDQFAQLVAQRYGDSVEYGPFLATMRESLDSLKALETSSTGLGAEPVMQTIADALGGLDARLVAAVLHSSMTQGPPFDAEAMDEFFAEAEELVTVGRDRANQAAGERLKALGTHAAELSSQSDQKMFVAGFVLVFAIVVLGLLAWLARSAERRARRGALTDSLTGLLNRRGFDDAVEQLRNRSNSWLVLVDLDHFKPVNDTYGHEVGDRALVAAAKVFQDCFEPLGGVLARLGGDEFAVIVGSGRERDIVAAANAAQERLTRIDAGANTVRLGSSAGIARFDHNVTAAEALAEADLAMYQAKRMGRGRAVVFDEASRRVLAAFRDNTIAGSMSISVQFQRRLADGQIVGMAIHPTVYGPDGRPFDDGLLAMIAEYSGWKFRLINATLEAIGRSERPRPPLGCRAWFTLDAADLRGPERVEEFWNEFVQAGWSNVAMGVKLVGAQTESYQDLAATVERLDRFGIATSVRVSGPQAVPLGLLDGIGVDRIVVDVAETTADVLGEVIEAAVEFDVESLAIGVRNATDAGTLAGAGVVIAQAATSVPWTGSMARTPRPAPSAVRRAVGERR